MKICLIGSTRFKDGYRAANLYFTRLGDIVHTVTEWASDLSPADKEIFDLVHLRKIWESDEVCLITDETGYFGDSTRRELIFSKIAGKGVMVFGIEQGKTISPTQNPDLAKKLESFL